MHPQTLTVVVRRKDSPVASLGPPNGDLHGQSKRYIIMSSKKRLMLRSPLAATMALLKCRKARLLGLNVRPTLLWSLNLAADTSQTSESDCLSVLDVAARHHFRTNSSFTSPSDIRLCSGWPMGECYRHT